MARMLKLTKDRVTIVDEADLDYLSQWKWHYNSHGYASRLAYENGKPKQYIYMHNAIVNPPDDMYVDHINRDGLDNRRCNLRICTKSQNEANKGLRRDNISGRKGVSWFKQTGKWRAYIRFNGKPIHIGYYDDIEDAYSAYKLKAHELFGEFAHD